jgi:hypothetical protein
MLHILRLNYFGTLDESQLFCPLCFLSLSRNTISIFFPYLARKINEMNRLLIRLFSAACIGGNISDPKITSGVHSCVGMGE